MLDDFREITKALDVPLVWLLSFAAFGFISLVAAVSLRSAAAAAVSCLVGASAAGLGIRAIVRPSQPLRLSPTSAVPYITTSRRLGAFYLLVGLVWIVLTVLAVISR